MSRQIEEMDGALPNRRAVADLSHGQLRDQNGLGAVPAFDDPLKLAGADVNRRNLPAMPPEKGARDRSGGGRQGIMK